PPFREHPLRAPGQTVSVRGWFPAASPPRRAPVSPFLIESVRRSADRAASDCRGQSSQCRRFRGAVRRGCQRSCRPISRRRSRTQLHAYDNLRISSSGMSLLSIIRDCAVSDSVGLVPNLLPCAVPAGLVVILSHRPSTPVLIA